MSPSKPAFFLTIVAAVLVALPVSAPAQAALSGAGPVAHAAGRGPIAHATTHKHAHCRGKHHKRRCAKAHKSSRKHVVSHSSRVRGHRTSILSSPPIKPTQPNAPVTSVTPGAPAGPVPAPTLAITGTVYYVSASGSDSNPGTSPSSAWRTVNRVNNASLRPGDGVLFEGGATFSDSILMPAVSGSAASPIVFGSYGSGNAILPQGVWFKGENDLAFENLTIGPEGNLQGTGSGITVEWCSIGNDSLAINATGSNSDWTIDDNTINHTGNSGMLLEGENFTVSGNTITNTGLDTSISYGKHGIYLKVSNATVTSNTITNFSADGISVRYRNSLISGNNISGGPIGIGWFQYDPIAGTSHWIGNTITATTDVGIYVSPSDIGGSTRESFVIEHNTIQPAAGVFMELHPTSGTYTTQENSLL